MRKPALLNIIFATLLASLLQISAVSAQTETWVSGAGSDNNTSSLCQRAAPCQSFAAAMSVILAGGTVFCADPVLSFGQGSLNSAVVITKDVTIDCTSGFGATPIFISGGVGISIGTPSINVTLRGLTIYGTDAPNGAQTAGVSVTAEAVVRIENCRIFGVRSGPGVQITPGDGTAVIKIQDTTITNNGSGISVTPTGGARVLISVDRSRIESNNGGGIKINGAAVTETTFNGASGGSIEADIYDTSVSFNAGNGINAIAGESQSIVSIKNSVITENGAAGVQANGVNAGVLLQTTLLDQNVAGATSVVSGGNMFTYGNNSIVGSAGSGFNHMVGLQ
jgi:hypothetical protein